MRVAARTDGKTAAPVDEVASILHERVGAARVKEALACNHWSDMTMQPRGGGRARGGGGQVSKQPKEREEDAEGDVAGASDSSSSSKKANGVPSAVPSLLSKAETKAGQDAAKSSRQNREEDAAPGGVVVPDHDLSAIFAGMNFADDFDMPPTSELAAFGNGDGDGDADDAEMFANIERFESVFEKMRAVRENAAHMSHEARRKLAEDTILEMCAYLDIDDGSGDEAEALGGYEVISDGEGGDADGEVDESTEPVVAVAKE